MTTLIRANLPVLVVIAPLFVAFILPPLARRIRLVEALALLGAVLGLGEPGIWLQLSSRNKKIPSFINLGAGPHRGGLNWWRVVWASFSCWWWVLVCRFSYLPRVILPPR